MRLSDWLKFSILRSDWSVTKPPPCTTYAEFKDIVGGIKEFVNPGESLDEIEVVIQETEREWSSFEANIKAEIRHLEIIER